MGHPHYTLYKGSAPSWWLSITHPFLDRLQAGDLDTSRSPIILDGELGLPHLWDPPHQLLTRTP